MVGVVKQRFDGLAEFVSRRARVRLLRLVLDDGMTQSEVAASVGVTQQAVNKWLNPKETHPCNKNLDRLLKLAWERDQDRVLRILQRELNSFSSLLSSFTKCGR